MNQNELSRLWQGIKEGKEQSFKGLFEYQYADLLRFGLRICFDRALVKDTIQDVFFEIWKKRAQLPVVKNHSAYLKQILKRKLIKKINEKNKKQIAVSNNRRPSESYETELIRQQDEKNKKQKLEQAFQYLTPKQREIIKLRFFEGLSYDEIADKTATQKRTIYNQIHSSLKVLKKSMLISLMFFLQ